MCRFTSKTIAKAVRRSIVSAAPIAESISAPAQAAIVVIGQIGIAMANKRHIKSAMNRNSFRSFGGFASYCAIATFCLLSLFSTASLAQATNTGSMAQARPANGGFTVNLGSGSGQQVGVGAFGDFGYGFGNPWNTPTQAVVNSSAGASNGAAAAATKQGLISLSAAATSGARTTSAGTVTAANGYWNDSFVIAASALHPQDSLGTFQGVLHIGGTLTLPCTATNAAVPCGIWSEQNFFRTNVVASVKLLTAAGSSAVTGGAGTSGDFSHGASVSPQVGGGGIVNFDIPFSVAFRYGTNNSLSVFGQVEAVVGSFGATAGREVDAVFTNGITWGGGRILDTQGQVVADASVLSASGFNYAAVSSVPEPGEFQMLFAGLAVLLSGLHRRRLRSWPTYHSK